MEFTKMHGLGNDFILINGFTQEIPADYSALSVELCRQHFGVGADGIMVETHNNPAAALCDGAQSLDLDQFDALMEDLKKRAPLENKAL